MALHGDPVTVSATLRRLEHRDGAVRACALRTLSWVAHIGDAEVISKARTWWLVVVGGWWVAGGGWVRLVGVGWLRLVIISGI